jgi:hypothetical protein
MSAASLRRPSSIGGVTHVMAQKDRIQAVAKAEAMRGNAVLPVSAPMLCL